MGNYILSNYAMAYLRMYHVDSGNTGKLLCRFLNNTTKETGADRILLCIPLPRMLGTGY